MKKRISLLSILLITFCIFAYGNEVSDMQHYFIKSGTSSYTYLLKIEGYATRFDAFWYGIIATKLPKAAKVNFKIEELHLEN